jgi:hypothetical protein
VKTNGLKCGVCQKILGYRNKTGFCTQHKGNNTLKCSCGADIYYLSKTGKCQKCYDKDYYQVNLDDLRKQTNDYYHENKESVNQKRALREKERWHSDPNFKLKKSLRSRFKKAMKENWVKGSFTKSLGCSIEELNRHLELKFYSNSITGEIMSWENYGSGQGTWQIDHKIAFCSVELTPENINLVGHYSNLQPLWFEDHCRKTIEDTNALRKTKK